MNNDRNTVNASDDPLEADEERQIRQGSSPENAREASVNDDSAELEEDDELEEQEEVRQAAELNADR